MAYDIVYGNETPSSKRVTQVYQATHVGEKYLPYMHRSFISFSFGGKNIEDFNLIAYTNGDRILRQGSSNFNNLTTNTDVLNGQLYWGTFFEGNTLDLELATDGMTQRLLDDFLRWFRGGETRELVLAEHPNRGILARIANPPSLSLLPFESATNLNLSLREYATSTTLYRGEISLTFQMDDSFWYSINNVFGHYDSETLEYKDTWIDANGEEINVFDTSKNKDVIKIMLEDGIPLSNMILSNMLMGNGLVAEVGQETGAFIAEDSFRFVCTKLPSEEEENELTSTNKIKVEYYLATLNVKMPVEPFDEEDPIYEDVLLFADEPSYSMIFDENLTSLGVHESDFNKLFNSTDISTILTTLSGFLQEEGDIYITNIWHDPAETHRISTDNTFTRIQGVEMKEQDGVELPKGYTGWNFYYAGTAPSYPILEFKLTPEINALYYIRTPANRFAKQDDLGENVRYNTFTIESESKLEFKFTTPNIYTSYNTAILIFSNNTNNKLVDDIYPLIRENVKHPVVRAWAIRTLDELNNSETPVNFDDNAAASACETLLLLFQDNLDLIFPATFTFDSKTGIATGTFTIRVLDANFPNTSETKTFTENVGDMVKSDWLVIKERNHPDDDNLIRGWSDTTLLLGGKLFAHRFYHNVLGVLTNVKLIYNNMYL